MRFEIKTPVTVPYQRIFDQFDERLFLALAPAFPPIQLLRFDGCEVGDEVHLSLGVGAFQQRWDALITEQASSEEEIYFIDKGQQLPFFLASWQHLHRIIRIDETKSYIIDDITYTTPFKLLDYLMYPVLYLQFRARKPIYQRYFV